MVRLPLNSSTCVIAHISWSSDAWGASCWSCGESIWSLGSEVDEGITTLSFILSLWHVTNSLVPLLWLLYGFSLPWTCLTDTASWPVTDQPSKPCVALGIAGGEKVHRTVLQTLNSVWDSRATLWVGWEGSCECFRFDYWGILGKDILVPISFNIYHGSQPHMSCWRWRGAQHDLE